MNRTVRKNIPLTITIMNVFAIGLSLSLASPAVADQPPTSFFAKHCYECHSGDNAESDVDLNVERSDWSNPKTTAFWEKVLAAVEDGRMPPVDADQPTASDRHAAVQTMHAMLRKNVTVGGTVLRRLNRIEYENTIRDILKVPFKTPPSFPRDAELDGFDNLGEGLILSPPLMEQYFEVATAVADMVLPPEKTDTIIEPETVQLTADDFSVNFEGSKIRTRSGSKVLRLVTKDEVLVRSCTWPTRFEAQHSGRYQLTVQPSAFLPNNDKSLQLRVLARKSANNVFQSTKDLRVVGQIEVDPTKPPNKHSKHQLDITLQKGETIAFYWANASMGWDRKDSTEAGKQLQTHFTNPKIHAAWLKMGQDRGRSPGAAWKTMKQLMQSGDLDLSDSKLKKPLPRITTTVRNELMGLFENTLHERGPALDIHAVSIHGPTKLIDDDEMKQQKQRTREFLGERQGLSDHDYATAILTPLLAKLFRRPATDDQVAKYVAVAMAHENEGHRFEDGLHLAIRTALCSPRFLYRTTDVGKLDDFDLASRLSYFLTSHPPDATLTKLAASGELSDPQVLKQQTVRLLKHRRSENFVNNFAGQWLDLNLLPEIMPDPRLLAFNDKDRNAIRQESFLFIKEILKKNLPLSTFIDPDFTYVNVRSAKLYMIKGIKGNDFRRVKLKRGGRVGGILGQASVMMATANGVDTQPVLRGVWLLENVFGDAPPPPPSNVPAIEPDTTGAKSIRELLGRHREDASCAQCHNKIDPLGFALENFDPVGRWRTHYPVYEKKPDGTVVTNKGLAIDSAGELPDGTKIKNVVDLKSYLVKNIDRFGECLAEKLLVYATGRRLNYADKLAVEQLVKHVQENGNGFQDLIIGVVQSESFLTK